MTVPALCHPNRPNLAKGLCAACYQRKPTKELEEIRAQYELEKQARITARAHSQKERANRLRRGDKWRDHTLRKRYNITAAYYDRMFEMQDGVCFICKKPSKRRLEVDHCHRSGRVRKLLCSRCNTIVAVIESDAERLAAANEYLKL